MMDSQQMKDPGFEALFDFSFRKFITLSIIKVLYVIGLVLIALAWLMLVVTGFRQGFMAGVGAMVVGALFAAAYVVFWRVWLELIVVVFRIGENTAKLVAAQGQTPAGHEPAEAAPPPPSA